MLTNFCGVGGCSDKFLTSLSWTVDSEKALSKICESNRCEWLSKLATTESTVKKLVSNLSCSGTWRTHLSARVPVCWKCNVLYSVVQHLCWQVFLTFTQFIQIVIGFQLLISIIQSRNEEIYQIFHDFIPKTSQKVVSTR